MRVPTLPLPLFLLLATVLLPPASAAGSDPSCASGLRAGLACCPPACARCGGLSCGLRSERHRTDCCPSSILTGMRLCRHQLAPCKLSRPRAAAPPPADCRSPPPARVHAAAASAPRRLRRAVRAFRRAVSRAGAAVRAVDWEGPAPFVLPRAYYRPRGLVLASRGAYNAVSNAPRTRDHRFSSYLPALATRAFQPYSGKRMFSPIMNNAVTVRFVKGRVPAKVDAFGAVFVDVRTRAVLTVFDGRGCRIRRVEVPRRPGGLSFAGVRAKGIAKVEIELGTISISLFAKKFRRVSVGDVVVLDDLIYGKPY